MRRLKDMTDGELIAERNKARREGNEILVYKIMRKLMRRFQNKYLYANRISMHLPAWFGETHKESWGAGQRKEE